MSGEESQNITVSDIKYGILHYVQDDVYIIMPEEYLDIVDENGNLTGQKELRAVVHEKGLWHRTVHVYFYRVKDNAIEILVHLRSKFKDQKPNMWDTRFGGHISSEFFAEQAVLSEVKEETGISATFNQFIRGLKNKYDAGKNREFVESFYFNFIGDEKELKFNDGEVQKVKWMDENSIIKSMENDSEIWTGKPYWFLRIVEDLKNKL
jgi:isopentenyl-diphosphate Delta-isomerase